ncbi:hypothetical protein DQ239_14080 [Blastococcus sp. TF02-09]|uniref:hypothetical protein n=1 Tax=Blastococcus sp. TF02-09 TaxID=2250576 RepID=UPI000DE97AD4|nr:hypothetical protein [Blastococcus sp. TF02-9]RBY76651.1 hypothetical protein DQ239_14080 [Blastococcus sp. TF02-9]
MTSDQGGTQGEPAGRPEGGSEPPPLQGWNAPPPPPQQGWGAPPPQQGWGAPPPQGWEGQPQQGWQQPGQWPGYGNPYEPPPPPGSADQPFTVRAGIGAFVATVVLGLVGSVVMFFNYDTVLDEAIAQAGAGLTGEDRETAQDIAEIVVQFSLVVSAIFTAVYLLFLWFAWRGRNWARIVLWVLGGLSVLSGFAGMGSGGTGVGYIDGLNVFSLLLTIAGIVLLALKPSNDWYRYMGWARATGRSR